MSRRRLRCSKSCLFPPPPAVALLGQTDWNSKFNGGGHINHSLFWANLAPASSPAAKTDAAPKLMEALGKKYGGYEKFQEEFKSVLLGLQGSGLVSSFSR